MATEIRAEVSQKNQYWIPKHRYYELLHFCRQYDGWQKALIGLDGMCTETWTEPIQTSHISDPTARTAVVREYYSKRIDLVKSICEKTDPELANYILAAVTTGRTYDKLEIDFEGMPCSRDKFYKTYRKFFWLLHLARE